ncbi:MAG TPA: hypothetical protein VK582_23640 [Pyrinomonadaceae bacterium]|nr:hypothetical protein [Pyrinomonadaceae bacterium]
MKFLLMFWLVLVSAVAPAPQTGRQWRPATYRGVTVGKSKIADMLRAWGKPKWSRTSRREADEESQVTWTNYERVGEFPGPTTVVSDTKTGVVTRINFYPDRLTKEQAVAHFGSSYIITRYAFDYCLDEEDSEPLYESPTGPVVSLEYRARGIAISIGYKDLVTKISYVGGPIGSTKSRCNP